MHLATKVTRPLCFSRETKRVVLGSRCLFSTSIKRNPRECSARSIEKRYSIGQNSCYKRSPLGFRFFSGDSVPEGHDPNPKLVKSAKALSLIVALSVLGGLQYFLLFRHLEKVPQTGRWRKMNITPEMEAQLGKDAFGSLTSQYKDEILPEDHPLTRHVHRIVGAILEANGLGTVVNANDAARYPFLPGERLGLSEAMSYKDLRWPLVVIRDDKIFNSTASSGGIVVFTGLFSLCKDENELAAILGHEIAHVVARHLAERYSKAKDWSLKQLLAGSFIPENQNQVKGDYQQMMATNLHVQELEADAIGLQLSSRACFDPQAAIDVNQRMATIEERLRRLHPNVKPTHPCSAERIEQLKNILSNAYKTMTKNPRCSSTHEALGAFRQSSAFASQ